MILSHSFCVNFFRHGVPGQCLAEQSSGRSYDWHLVYRSGSEFIHLHLGDCFHGFVREYVTSGSPNYSIRLIIQLIIVLNVRTAIPMVMGANVGTSLTSTLVSLTQVTDKVSKHLIMVIKSSNYH